MSLQALSIVIRNKYEDCETEFSKLDKEHITINYIDKNQRIEFKVEMANMVGFMFNGFINIKDGEIGRDLDIDNKRGITLYFSNRCELWFTCNSKHYQISDIKEDTYTIWNYIKAFITHVPVSWLSKF